MEPYAVVETGGKQYRVKVGDTLKVERIEAEPGSSLKRDAVVAVSDGQALRVGTPRVDGAAVSAQVVKHIRGPKLVAFIKRRRKGSARKVGHRQELTVLKITGLE